MPRSSYKRSTFSKYFEKWCSLEKLTPVDQCFCLEYKNTFSTRKYIFFIQILKSFSKNRMNKKRKKLDLNILSTVLKPFFENCKQYTVRFFQITHPQKYFGNVLFGSSFFNTQCMYIWHKMQLVIKKNIRLNC